MYEIKSLEPEATTRQSSEVSVDAADRESPIIPLGLFAEIRDGSSAMQAFAGICAAMVASTLLQHTALRGIIESERLDRLDRVCYKNRYLVSSSLIAHFDLSVLCLKCVFDLNAYF